MDIDFIQVIIKKNRQRLDYLGKVTKPWAKAKVIPYTIIFQIICYFTVKLNHIMYQEETEADISF